MTVARAPTAGLRKPFVRIGVKHDSKLSESQRQDPIINPANSLTYNEINLAFVRIVNLGSWQQ